MTSLNIGLFGNSPELLTKVASAFGKKGTISDITLYDTKSSGKIITTILPHSYPEKIQSLFYAINICDFPVIVADKIDSVLGEIIVAIEEADFKKGFILASDSYVAEQLRTILKGTKLLSFVFIEGADDSVINDLRIKAFDTIFSRESGKPNLSVDHSFGVKGVGTVVLGLVHGDSIKLHDKFLVVPGKKETSIKSIQKHDENVQSAEPGDRVGLCLKDVSVEDVDRGTILSNSAIQLKKSEIKISVNKFYKQTIGVGHTLFLISGMQYVSFKVNAGNVQPGQTNILGVEFEKNIALEPGQKIFFVNPNLKMRIVGSGTFESNRA